MTHPLPQFARYDRDKVLKFAQQIFVRTSTSDDSFLVDLIEFQDGHYRAIFKAEYFVLAAHETEPTKSQWNTLKKKLKRHDPRIFIFKEHGYKDEQHCYLDFGFFQHELGSQPKNKFAN